MIFEKVMTQIFDPKLQQIFRKENLQILRKTFGKGRRGPQSKLIFFVVGFLNELRKKLKIVTLTEAPFMMKSDF